MDEDDRILGAHHGVYPAEWTSHPSPSGRGRAASGASDSNFRSSLTGAPSASPPLAAVSAPHPACVSEFDAPFEALSTTAADRWRRSLEVEDEPGAISDSSSLRGSQFNSGSGIKPCALPIGVLGAEAAAGLSYSTPPVSGDASSVTGSVSGLSCISDAERASAALVESGVEQIKAALRQGAGTIHGSA